MSPWETPAGGKGETHVWMNKPLNCWGGSGDQVANCERVWRTAWILTQPKGPSGTTETNWTPHPSHSSHEAWNKNNAESMPARSTTVGAASGKMPAAFWMQRQAPHLLNVSRPDKYGKMKRCRNKYSNHRIFSLQNQPAGVNGKKEEKWWKFSKCRKHTHSAGAELSGMAANGTFLF